MTDPSPPGAPPARVVPADGGTSHYEPAPPPAAPGLREAAQAVLDAASRSGWYNHAAIIALAVALAETPGEPR